MIEVGPEVLSPQTTSTQTSASRKRAALIGKEGEREANHATGSKNRAGSGCGIVEKGDGINDAYLTETKTTDAESYRVQQTGLAKIEHQAAAEGRLPLLVVVFKKPVDGLHSRQWAMLPLRVIHRLLRESRVDPSLLDDLRYQEDSDD